VVIIPVRNTYPNFIEDATEMGLGPLKTVLMVLAFVVDNIGWFRHHAARNSKFLARRSVTRTVGRY
jgi:hypothetical protein